MTIVAGLFAACAVVLFGVMDSDRTDVAYEDFEGHRLDRKMLDLLRKCSCLGT